MKIEHQKIFRGPSKILKNISWPINICLKNFIAPTKILHQPPTPPTHCSYILNVQSLPTQIVNLTAEIVIPIGMQTKEVKAEMETHPVTVEIKISKYSI